MNVTVGPTYYKEGTTRLDVTRLLPSGERDTHFGRRGYVALPGSRGATPVALDGEPDGGVVVAFAPSTQTPGKVGPEQLLFERVTPVGRLDRTFGHRGIVRMRFPGQLTGLAIATHREHLFVAAGERPKALDEGRDTLLLAAYTHEGRLYRKFGRSGIARYEFAPGPGYRGVGADAIAFDASGDVIVAGKHRIATVDTPAGEGFIARYTPHGRDCSFGSGGVVVDPSMSDVSAVALEPDGRIVVAGGGSRFVAARYMGGGKSRTCSGEPMR